MLLCWGIHVVFHENLEGSLTSPFNLHFVSSKMKSMPFSVTMRCLFKTLASFREQGGYPRVKQQMGFCWRAMPMLDLARLDSFNFSSQSASWFLPNEAIQLRDVKCKSAVGWKPNYPNLGSMGHRSLETNDHACFPICFIFVPNMPISFSWATQSACFSEVHTRRWLPTIS